MRRGGEITLCLQGIFLKKFQKKNTLAKVTKNKPPVKRRKIYHPQQNFLPPWKSNGASLKAKNNIAFCIKSDQV